jgi:hypothetical protein
LTALINIHHIKRGRGKKKSVVLYYYAEPWWCRTCRFEFMQQGSVHGFGGQGAECMLVIQNLITKKAGNIANGCISFFLSACTPKAQSTAQVHIHTQPLY